MKKPDYDGLLTAEKELWERIIKGITSACLDACTERIGIIEERLDKIEAANSRKRLKEIVEKAIIEHIECSGGQPQ